jgi:hypothetical protein
LNVTEYEAGWMTLEPVWTIDMLLDDAENKNLAMPGIEPVVQTIA